MEPEVVLAKPADVERLLPHIEAFWAFEKLDFEATKVRKALSELIDTPSLGCVLLAQQGTDILGYVVLTYGYSIEHGGRDALIDELYVHADARSIGLGTRLLTQGFVHCADVGIARVHLEVDDFNPRAAALYARLGFAPNNRRRFTKRL